MWSCVGEWSTNFNNNNIEISNCIIDVDESGTWQNGLAPAIAIEFNSDIECLNTNIHNNWINNHISLVTWEKNRASYRVHHNVADFRWKDDGSAGVRYAYFVEANDSYFEIDHNIVLSGYYPVAQWGTNHINKDMLMHHNIFYAPQGGSGWPPFFHWNADYNGFKFYNNTIIDTKNISEIFDLEAGGLCYSNSEIKNNVIMSTSNRGNILGNSCAWNGTVSNNLFYNISAAGSNYITSNPLLVNSGDMTLSESFGLQSNSPAINSGVAITGITTDAVGLPDMGAVKYGQTPWVAGPIATTVITARGENLPNEGKEKAFDGNNSTKWLDMSATSWIQIQYASAITYNKYVIVSGNDEPARDPKNWTLKGSNNGSTWITLNTQTNQTWTARNQAKTFSFTNSTAYSYYNLTITANNGATMTQLSEITLSNVAVVAVWARGENAPNESKEKAFDESNTTKWLDFNPNSWITVQYSSAYTPTQYTIVSGNDEPTRDPKSWELKGSNNGSTWTTLNTQTNQAWTARNQAKTYSFSNSTAYTYYNLTITANNGATITQLSEISFGGLKSAYLINTSHDNSTSHDNNTLNIYPNPATNVVTLNFSKLVSSEPSIVTVFNLEGKLMLRTYTFEGNISLNLKGNITRGKYIVCVQNKNETATQHLIVE